MSLPHFPLFSKKNNGGIQKFDETRDGKYLLIVDHPKDRPESRLAFIDRFFVVAPSHNFSNFGQVNHRHCGIMNKQGIPRNPPKVGSYDHPHIKWLTTQVHTSLLV